MPSHRTDQRPGPPGTVPRLLDRGRGRAGLIVVAGMALVATLAGCGREVPSAPGPAGAGSGSTAGLGGGAPGPSGSGITIVLPPGTSPPGSNPVPPGSTLDPTASPHGAAASSGVAAPQIAALSTPTLVRCDQPGPATVALDYRTSGANRIVVMVDGDQPVDLAPQSGPISVTIPCDGGTHMVVVAAVAATGQSAVDTRAVPTQVGAGPTP